MAKKSNPYEEGTVFAIPLANGGYGIGIITRRKPGRGNHGLFGYFFGPRHKQVPDIVSITNLSPTDALFSLMFGDLRFRNDEWNIIGNLPGFVRENWPFPIAFKMPAPPHDPNSSIWVTQYDDQDPGSSLRYYQVSRKESENFPEDSLFGAGAVEFYLNQQIQILEADSNPHEH